MSTKTRERGAADIPAMYMAVIPYVLMSYTDSLDSVLTLAP